jgi:hypothetical protein
MASLLASPPGCVCDHEREPKLLEELIAFLDGRLGRAELVAILRESRSPAAIGGERLSGEANQRLSFVLPALAEAFPSCKVVWLLRDGRDAVASMHHRDWYHEREAEVRSPVVRGWARTRLHADRVGDLSAKEWKALDAFGRCCWYWSYTSRVIAEATATLPLPVLSVRLEELEASRPELASLIGVADLAQASVPHSNAASSRRPPSWRLWSGRQREQFDRLCGPVMDLHYPGWRSELDDEGRGARMAAFAARSANGARKGLAARTRRLRARFGPGRAVPHGRTGAES